MPTDSGKTWFLPRSCSDSVTSNSILYQSHGTFTRIKWEDWYIFPKCFCNTGTQYKALLIYCIKSLSAFPFKKSVYMIKHLVGRCLHDKHLVERCYYTVSYLRELSPLIHHHLAYLLNRVILFSTHQPSGTPENVVGTLVEIGTSCHEWGKIRGGKLCFTSNSKL